uniref:Uncharacterized protein n=1 Tax=Pieris brassicae granulosis virus TaxID=10465 RepID=A0A7G9U8P8_GVPB|nr:hypothetical protein [Pieris brassicae granulovirus]
MSVRINFIEFGVVHKMKLKNYKNTNDRLVNVVKNVDCVWTFSIDSKHIITLVGIKIFNNHDIQSIIDREIDRVINFDDNYTTTNL